MSAAEQGIKKKNKSNALIKVIIVILMCVVCVSLYKVGTILWEYHKGTQQYKQVERIAKVAARTSEYPVSDDDTRPLVPVDDM